MLSAFAAGLLAATLAVDGPLVAGVAESWERWERLQGLGWGDGYHACAPSGHRPFADLPPRDPMPPAADGWPFPHGLRWQPHAIASPGLTCYDLFDAGHEPFVDDPFVDDAPSVLSRPPVGEKPVRDVSETDRTGRDRFETDRIETDRIETGRIGTDRIGRDRTWGDGPVPPAGAVSRPAAAGARAEPPPRISRRIVQPRVSRPRASDYRLPPVTQPRRQDLRLPPVEPIGSR